MHTTEDSRHTSASATNRAVSDGVDPGPRTPGLWSITESGGVLGGCEVPEAGLVALTIVEDLDELE
ncbi:MAG: hypothetical protein ACXWEI_22880, partial [Mycobacterium sp.]